MASSDAMRARGTLHEVSVWRVLLTLTLSPREEKEPFYSLSTIVTLAMPPPSHMVCRP
jgi:hypothetical protein